MVLYAFISSILLLMNPLELFPDSVDVIVQNNITDASIISMHYLVAGTLTMVNRELERPISSGEHLMIRLPYRFYSRMVFGTDLKGNYRIAEAALLPFSDTVAVSRAQMEFGGFFDVVLGSQPFVIKSTLPVPITTILILNDSLNTESIIGSNPMMTGEVLFLWLDRDSVIISAIDLEGNPSSEVHMIRTGNDSLFTIGIADFLTDTGQLSPGDIRVINALNGAEIKEIEVYPVTGEPFFLDLSQDPLQLWQTATIQVQEEVDYIVGIDCLGRTFSIDDPEPSLDAFIIDWWHLDFDFEFPNRRR